MREYRQLRRVVVVLLVAVAVLAVAGVGATVLSVPVRGDSMEPALEPGDRVFARSADPADLERFAVVIGQFGANSADVVKRVIGLPGDRISIEKYGVGDGTVRIQPGGTGPWFVVTNPSWDGRWRQVASNCCTPEGKDSPRPTEQVIPAGMLFVLGDNIGASDDSRRNGWMPARLVRQVAGWRVYPPTRLGAIDNPAILTPAP